MFQKKQLNEVGQSHYKLAMHKDSLKIEATTAILRKKTPEAVFEPIDETL